MKRKRLREALPVFCDTLCKQRNKQGSSTASKTVNKCLAKRKWIFTIFQLFHFFENAKLTVLKA